MCIVFAITVGDEPLLHLTSDGYIVGNSCQQRIGIVKRSSVCIAVTVGMIELVMDSGLEAVTPSGILPGILGMAQQPCDVGHIVQALADEAVVDVENRFTLHIDTFGGKPVAQEPKADSGVGPRMQQTIASTVFLDIAKPSFHLFIMAFQQA